MRDFRYLDDAATLAFDRDKCVGCGACGEVCPHRIFRVADGKADMADRDACMECGACARNCPTGAISVTPGTGCAALIVQTWIARLTGRKIKGDCC
ncbi:mercury methylation ferredoxin HgcB [Pseudodesulfovibrio sp.]|uniref:mercury methylation ferredoxin HgcB n=1 Tax=Pseudodesulfovibrio sp. TaxID=2035812 RepID=UPI002604DAF6|nr:mercury methylation ferredoxin HgcB [Pseudodesulfovibrio sp.]MDD3313776.1 mercury methylation ferredoxin HgcB [Pseudodesulfovibrio sp.]